MSTNDTFSCEFQNTFTNVISLYPTGAALGLTLTDSINSKLNGSPQPPRGSRTNVWISLGPHSKKVSAWWAAARLLLWGLGSLPQHKSHPWCLLSFVVAAALSGVRCSWGAQAAPEPGAAFSLPVGSSTPQGQACFPFAERFSCKSLTAPKPHLNSGKENEF